MKTVSLKKILGIAGITIAFAAVLAVTLLYVKHAEDVDKAKELGFKEQMTEIIERQPEFDIETTAGTIRIKLYNKTPEHLKNFEKLVKEHFYDSILFHRVIEGFMIQTGDPFTKDTANVELYGQGGPGYTLPAEFVPEYTHKKGALAAARRGDRANPKKSSSGSQFYIVQDEGNCMHLDGQYTVFGETIDGLDVVDKIAAAPTDPYDRPYEDIRIITIKPVLADVKESLDSAAVYAGLDSAEIAKLDSLAKAAGIGEEDFEKLDSLANAIGLGASDVQEGLKNAVDGIKEAAEALEGKDEKEIKEMAGKAVKDVAKKVELKDLKKLEKLKVNDIGKQLEILK